MTCSCVSGECPSGIEHIHELRLESRRYVPTYVSDYLRIPTPFTLHFFPYQHVQMFSFSFIPITLTINMCRRTYAIHLRIADRGTRLRRLFFKSFFTQRLRHGDGSFSPRSAIILNEKFSSTCLQHRASRFMARCKRKSTVQMLRVTLAEPRSDLRLYIFYR